jgi:hypothetical protein
VSSRSFLTDSETVTVMRWLSSVFSFNLVVEELQRFSVVDSWPVIDDVLLAAFRAGDVFSIPARSRVLL